MTPEDILRFDRMVPRYTSLPNAAMGGAGEGGPRGDGLEDFADALATLAPLEASGAVHRRGAHIRVSPQAGCCRAWSAPPSIAAYRQRIKPRRDTRRRSDSGEVRRRWR
jgi:hypothetical protein